MALALKTLLQGWWQKATAQIFVPKLASATFLTGLPALAGNGLASGADPMASTLSSVVMGVIQWGMRALPEAPIIVQRRRGEDLQHVPDHPLARLLNHPNAFYSGESLLAATYWSWALFGNAYWRVVKRRNGEPAELWWIAPWRIIPAYPPDGRTFISHYTYTPDGPSVDLPLDGVVHFRHGLHPLDPRLGLSPLQSVLREVWSDSEASQWICALLRNMAVPGLIITPDDEHAVIKPEDVETIKRYIQSRFTGEHRGEPMTFEMPVKVQKLSFAPSDMDLSAVRNVAEERVSACLGIPAAVIGYGTGLENTKVGATMYEMVRLAWTNGVIPVQRVWAGEIGRTLLAAFEANPEQFLVEWDYRQVKALQEDETAKAERWSRLYQSGIALRGEARLAMGLHATAADAVYVMPISSVLIGPGAALSGLGPRHIPGDWHPLPLHEERPTLPPAEGEALEDDMASLSGALETKQGSTEDLINTLIRRHAVHLDEPPPALARLMQQVSLLESQVRARGVSLLLPVLDRLGVRVALAAREATPWPLKQNLSARVHASRVVETLPMTAIVADLTEAYRQLYDLLATELVKVLGEGLDLPTELSPMTRQRLQIAAQERVSRLNIPPAVLRSLVSVFEQAQVEGLDDTQVAQLIEQEVPKGRWRSSQVRAQVIAQTELRVAANLATIFHAREAGLTHLLCFDGLLATSDETCIMRHGLIVTTEEAQVLANIEHPRGTLMFSPLSIPMLQQAGVL